MIGLPPFSRYIRIHDAAVKPGCIHLTYLNKKSPLLMGFLMSSDRREYYSFKDIILFNKSCSDFSISPSLDAKAVNLAITSLSFSLEEKVTSSFVKAGRFGLFIKLKNSPFSVDVKPSIELMFSAKKPFSKNQYTIGNQRNPKEPQRKSSEILRTS